MQILPAIDITEKTNTFMNSPNPFKGINPYLKNIVLRTILVMITGILATVIPKFGLFINLTGAFSCTALAFILPVYMYNIVEADTITKNRKLAHNVLMVFGSICGLVSFVVSLREIVESFSDV
jgi:sodium-coupled neutral amino acid transporter 11